MSKALVTFRSVTFVAVALLSPTLVSCRSRAASTIADAAASTPTVDVVYGEEARFEIEAGKAPENVVRVSIPEDGLYEWRVVASLVTPPAPPPEPITVAIEGGGLTAPLTGRLEPDPKFADLWQATGVFLLEKGDYALKVRHGSLPTGQWEMDAYVASRAPRPVDGTFSSGGTSGIVERSQFPVAMELKVPETHFYQFEQSARISLPRPFNAPEPAYKMPCTLIDDRGVEAVAFDAQHYGGESLAQLPAGHYRFRCDQVGLPDGSLYEFAWWVNPLYHPGTDAPMPTLPELGVQSVQSMSSNYLALGFAPKGIFGYAATLPQKARVDVGFFADWIPLLGRSEGRAPPDPELRLEGPDDFDRVLQSTRGSTWFNDIWTEAGKYRAVFVSDTAITDWAVKLTGRYTNLTIPEGGEDPKNIVDPAGASVTTTPPENYQDDDGVTGKPYPAGRLRLAMQDVLAAMEQTRATFHRALPSDVTPTARNTVEEDDVAMCLGNTAEHWSDITIHYYCQHGDLRYCYTDGVRSRSQAIADDASLSPDAKKAALAGVRRATFTDCASRAKPGDEWEWLLAHQGSVFQYVMFSQTYAFDMADQQRVINRFYRIEHPEDRDECLAKRPRRAIDPTDGTHCLVDKTFTTALHGAYR
jgi:hypothetical protein